MSTSKPRVTEAHPEAPPELLARRDPLIAGLEKAAKSASPTGTLHQVLRKMVVLVSSTRQGAGIEPQVFQDVQEAFLRFSEDTSAAVPAILTEALEWTQAFFVARGFARPGDESEAASPPAPASAAAPRAAAKTAAKKDSFETSSTQRARSLTGEVPVPAAPAQPAAPEKQQQQDLESFKTWMKNPALGKLKG
ncbi:hypothetical protein [Vitiosangium sp. GDMCC 1.1324]|uniref:hypothetical protein n=1 Tax=Vitiosangium sp. (strain GDMCC 1.1324) TaxID=2138576 RepID=UPI000D3B9D16|nr:hypothetical protein [Vitiosangium sp. GDMCC 1.1324]PTL80496.1 hypothetical protein DAT35_28080 [Vitiosangium sp. GDMCC 1.1324]